MPSWMKWAVAILIGCGIIVAGWKLTNSRFFFWLLPFFFVVNCLVLIIVVLLQSGKAADLAGAFGGAGSQTAFGPRGAANVLSKATTWCAIMFMLCAMALVLRTDKAVGQGSSILERVSKPAPTRSPAKVPAAPATTTPATPAAPATTPVTTPPAPTTSPSTAPVQPPSDAPAASQPPSGQKPSASQPAPAQPKKP
ncbi:MAG TPA: preprotein translocase subunit SecG [Candidatus Acidoferrum sp.]|nr:preprotein translocase subunit SecG [Candidatus Acidoferrum sp.]